MALDLDTAKAIYRAAIDQSGSDDESVDWWAEVADEVRDVVAARTINQAAGVIDWWHHDWTCVSDTALAAAKRIRDAAKAVARKA